MKNKFTNFLNRFCANTPPCKQKHNSQTLRPEGAHVLLALFVAMTIGVGNVWGKTWNVNLTGSGVSQDGITLTGDYAANASVGSSI